MTKNRQSMLNGERLYRDFILNKNSRNDTYSTIAILGEWGCGKSTSKEEFIKKCKNNTDSKQIITIDYKALQFEETSQITSDLYCQISEAIKNCHDNQNPLDQLKRWIFVINRFRATAKLKKESISSNIGASYIVGGLIVYILINLFLPVFKRYLQDYQISFFGVDYSIYGSADLLLCCVTIMLFYSYYWRNQLLSLFAGVLPYKSHIQELHSALKSFGQYYRNYELVLCVDELDRLNSATVKILLDEIWNIKETFEQIRKTVSNKYDLPKIKIFVFYDNDILHDLLLKADINKPNIYLQKFFDNKLRLPMPYFYNGLLLFFFKLLEKVQIVNLPSSDILLLIAENMSSFRKFENFCRDFYKLFRRKENYKYFFEDKDVLAKKDEIDVLIVAFSIQYLFELDKMSGLELINSQITKNECKNYIDKSVSKLSQIYYFSTDQPTSENKCRQSLSDMLNKLSEYNKAESKLMNDIYQQEEKSIRNQKFNNQHALAEDSNYHIDTIMAEVRKHLIVMQDVDNPLHQSLAPRAETAMFLAIMNAKIAKLNEVDCLFILKDQLLVKIEELLDFKWLFFISDRGRKFPNDQDNYQAIDCFTFNKSFGYTYGETLYELSHKIYNIKLDFKIVNPNFVSDEFFVLKSKNFTNKMMQKHFEKYKEIIQMFLILEFTRNYKHKAEDSKNEDNLKNIIEDLFYQDNRNRSSADTIRGRYIEKKSLNIIILYQLCELSSIHVDIKKSIDSILGGKLYDNLYIGKFSYTEEEWYQEPQLLHNINTIYIYPFLSKIQCKCLKFQYAPNETGEYQKIFSINLKSSIKDILTLAEASKIQNSIIKSILRSMIIYTMMFANSDQIEATHDTFGIVSRVFDHFHYQASNIIDAFFAKNSPILSQSILDKIHSICDNNNPNNLNVTVQE